MFANNFAVFSDHTEIHFVPIVPALGLTTLSFPSYSGVVGDLVGPKWGRVTKLKEDFQKTFPGFDFSAEYDGNAFTITIPTVPEQIAYLNLTFGSEIALANEAIQTDPNFAGAVIGKGGKGLRQIEAKAPVDCTVYHDVGAFYVKFPYDTPTTARITCMAYIKQAVCGRARWLEDRLSDTNSSIAGSIESADTITAPSETSEASDISDLFSYKSPTPSEAHF
jgi:hypothetical protein